jgi:signal peptidase I
MTSTDATLEAQQAKERGKARRRSKPVWREYLEALVVAVLLAMVIRTFGFQAFRIPTGSMEDTLLVGDYLFVNKFLYGAEVPLTGGKRLPGFAEPERGDIIVFRYPKDTSQDYIKRCVAVAGDTLLYKNKVLHINGEPQVEAYTKFADGERVIRERDFYGPVVVPEGHLFMMGDNRDRSSDSRYWEFLETKLIRGKAMFIYWSWDGRKNRPRFSRIFDLIR